MNIELTDNQNIVLDQTQLTACFEAWLIDYLANPGDYVELDSAPPASIAEAQARHLLVLARKFGTKPQKPSPSVVPASGTMTKGG